MIRNYFVDEAGDGNLFAGRGRVIVGTPGCSQYFILGMLDIPDPELLNAELAVLRSRLRQGPGCWIQSRTHRTENAFDR